MTATHVARGAAADVDRAVALANGTDYGLGVGIHTRDVDRALRVAGRVDAGYVMINGLVVMDSYTSLKTVVARVGPAREGSQPWT